MIARDSSSTGGARIFAVQAAAIIVMVSVLQIGFTWQREIRELDLKHGVQRAIHIWDGRVWFLWAAAAPLILWLIRSNPLARGERLRSTLRLIAGSAGIYFILYNLRYLIRLWALRHAGEPLPQPLWTNYVHTQQVLLPLDFLAYCCFFAASFAIDYHFMYRQRVEEVLRLNLRAAELQSDLNRAELAALRGQLHPHFLFNAFNAIATLVRENRNDAAVEMIAQLSELLRLAIQNVNVPELPLAQEFDFAVRYLEVEKVRFSDKLRTDIALDAEAGRCVVPNLLLQPLVENAVKHGISRRVEPGFVRLRGGRRGDRLVVEILDDGGAIAAPHSGREGTGLRNTRSRLERAYGTDYHFDIARRPEGGTMVTLDLPWRDGPVCTAPAIAG